MLTIIPGQTVVLPVTGGAFPGNPGQPQSGERWDILYCPNPPTLDFTYDAASDQAPAGCSVAYDPVANTLAVTMGPLAGLHGPGGQPTDYGTWVVVYDTQPGPTHVAGAGRSAFFTFAASSVAPPPIPVPTLTATPILVGNVPTILLEGH